MALWLANQDKKEKIKDNLLGHYIFINTKIDGPVRGRELPNIYIINVYILYHSNIIT